MLQDSTGSGFGLQGLAFRASDSSIRAPKISGWRVIKP